jgi:hypothetical protein
MHTYVRMYVRVKIHSHIYFQIYIQLIAYRVTRCRSDDCNVYWDGLVAQVLIAQNGHPLHYVPGGLRVQAPASLVRVNEGAYPHLADVAGGGRRGGSEHSRDGTEWHAISFDLIA